MAHTKVTHYVVQFLKIFVSIIVYVVMELSKEKKEKKEKKLKKYVSLQLIAIFLVFLIKFFSHQEQNLKQKQHQKQLLRRHSNIAIQLLSYHKHKPYRSLAVPGSEVVVESRSVIRNAKNARGLGRDRAIFPAATAPFPKSCASYFRFARFNTFPLYYLRAWHQGNRSLVNASVFLYAMNCSEEMLMTYRC